MKLVQIFLPRYDNRGRRFPSSAYARERQLLVNRFGGMTAYAQAPAVGLWKDGPATKRDELIIFEVLMRRVDRKWWMAYRNKLGEAVSSERSLGALAGCKGVVAGWTKRHFEMSTER